MSDEINPKPVIEKHDHFYVVRDDMLNLPKQAKVKKIY